MKKAIYAIAVFVLVICLFSGCGNTKTSPVEDFTYTILNGEVYITGYVGTDREIVIPDEIEERPVTQIGEEAFSGYDLTYIVIPDTVTQIQESAFESCSCLEKVSFPKNLEVVHKNAFSNCEALKEIELPGLLQRISEGAFENSGLESVVLPDDLQYIANNAFGDCENLKSLSIPDDVELYINTQSTAGSYDGLSLSLTMFNSFIGSTASNEQSYKGEYEYTPFDKLPTVIIVKEGSFAHQQLLAYEWYGVITYEVKG